jgi:hypothetical protein
MNSLQATEAEAATLEVAPRVRLSDIEAAIAERYDFTAADAVRSLDPTLRLLSICILKMSNGFMVVGKSAPASPENFDAGFGRKLAYEDAVRQLWPLMGFALRERLASE